MITRVQVKNFRNLADVDVHLSPLTVLVGRNGAGKSTFLDALRFVRDALEKGLDIAISQSGGIESVRRKTLRGRPHDIEISLELDLELDHRKVPTKYSFVIGTGQQEKRRVKQESVRIESDVIFETRAGKWANLSSSSIFSQERMSEVIIAPDALMLPTLSNLYQATYELFDDLTAASYYSVFPNTLRIPQRQSSEILLSEDGQNLGTTVQSILRDGDFQSDLIAAMTQIVNGVQEVRVRETGGYLVTELKHKTQSEHSLWFPLAQESDGTLRVLALLAALYQKAPHALIAIEEPELSVHPGALIVLSEVIGEAASRSQVIITTQSPDLISRFHIDQLRVVEMVNGDTSIGPIDESQREAINTQLFSAGDLLRIEGLHVSSQEEPAPSYA